MGGAGGDGAKNVPWQKQLLAVAAFASTNIGLNVFNSWALHKGKWPDFEFPVFYTMWHMIVTSLAALLLLAFVNPAPTGMPSRAQFWEYKDGLIPIAICTTLNTGLNNLSLTMVSLFVNQVIKATAPLPTAFFSFVLAGKTYSQPILLAVATIVMGSILANVHSMTSSSSSDNSLLGVVICATSLLANALKPVLSMKLMSTSTVERPKLAPTVVLFYDSALSFVFMLVYWLLSPEREAPVSYLANPATTFVGVGIVLCGASMAFTFNLAVYYFVLYTSALTCTVGANGIKILLITAGAISAGVTDALSWCGILLVTLAMAVYAYLNFTESQRPKAPPGGAEPIAPPPPGGSVAAVQLEGGFPSWLRAFGTSATEKTPLVQQGGSKV